MEVKIMNMTYKEYERFSKEVDTQVHNNIKGIELLVEQERNLANLSTSFVPKYFIDYFVPVTIGTKKGLTPLTYDVILYNIILIKEDKENYFFRMEVKSKTDYINIYTFKVNKVECDGFTVA